MQAFACRHTLGLCFMVPWVMDRREEEDLILMWKSDHRVSHNYMVEVLGLWQLSRCSETSACGLEVLGTTLSSAWVAINGLSSPGFLPPEPAM